MDIAYALNGINHFALYSKRVRFDLKRKETRNKTVIFKGLSKELIFQWLVLFCFVLFCISESRKTF